MACRYVFTEEQIEALAKAAKANKRKDVDRRLRALLMRAKGNKLAEIAQATGYSFSNITKLVRTYRARGLAAIVETHNGGNHRNMSYEEETALLKPFEEKTKAGQMIEISEIKAAYQEAVGHSVGASQIYYVLHRHKWRKVIPRSQHPKKQAKRSLRPQKINTRIAELKKVFHNEKKSVNVSR